jgi:hypothetical protein
MLDISRQSNWKRSRCSISTDTGVLMKIECPVFELDACKIYAVNSLSIFHKYRLEDTGCSKQLLAFSQEAAIGFVFGPLFSLTALAIVDNISGITKLVF